MESCDWKIAIINDAAARAGSREPEMRNQTETLRVGAPAPEYRLAAANREGDFSLSDLLSEGPGLIEFLRGTW